jgi:hypothetical protein
MSKQLVILTLLVFQVFFICAQNTSNRPTREDIFNRKWDFVVSKAELKATDAAKVKPLFMELEAKIWEMYAGNREIFRSQRRRNPGAIVDYKAINDAMIETEISKANLQKEYYLKLQKVIDAETINKLFHAEKAYQRDLIQGMPVGNRQGQPPLN